MRAERKKLILGSCYPTASSSSLVIVTEVTMIPFQFSHPLSLTRPVDTFVRILFGNIGALNSLDLLGRSVGLVAHGYLVAAVGRPALSNPGTSLLGIA